MVRLHYIVQLTDKGVIGDTSHAPRNPGPENHNNPVRHDPSNPDPTPEDHNNHRDMSNSDKDRDKGNSHKDSGNKLGDAFQLPGKR
jgi:hypothetical protein